MARKLTIGGTFTVNTVDDGAQGNPAPFYREQQYGWSVTLNGDSPTDNVAWADIIPAKIPSKPNLWMRDRLMTWSGTAYTAGNWTYARITGENGTGVQIKGYITIAEVVASVGDADDIFAYLTEPDFPYTPITTGDCYIYEGDGHLYFYTGTQWIDAGKIQGDAGVSSYMHVAWAHAIDATLGYPTAGMGFTTTKAAGDSYEYMGTCVNNTAGADPETPETYTWNNIKGAYPVYLYLDNDSDVMIYSTTGDKVTPSVYSQATLYVNGEATTPEISAVSSSGVSYTISDESINVTECRSANGYVVVRATHNGTDYYATFNVRRVVDGDRFEIIPTPGAVTYNLSESKSSVNTLEFKIFHTSTSQQRHALQDIPDGIFLAVRKFRNGSSSEATYAHTAGSGIWTFPFSFGTDYYSIILYRSGQQNPFEEQTIPVAYVSNGRGPVVVSCSPSVIAIPVNEHGMVEDEEAFEVYIKIMRDGEVITTPQWFTHVASEGSGFTIDEQTDEYVAVRGILDDILEPGIMFMEVDCANGETYPFAIGITTAKRGVRGTAGLNAITLDLDNEHDTMQYATDATGTQRNLTGSVRTVPSLYDGDTDKTSSVTFTINAVGCTAAMANGACIVTGVSAAKGTVEISCTYRGATYSKVFTVDKVVDEDKYELELLPKSVSCNISEREGTPDIRIKIRRTYILNGSLATEYIESLYDSNHNPIMTLTVSPANIASNTAPEAISETPDANGWYFKDHAWGWQTTSDDGDTSVILTKGSTSVVLDSETVPFNIVENGADGEGIEVRYSATGASSDAGHTTFQPTDRYMKMRRGSGGWSAWFLIVGENGLNGSYTDFGFAISAYPNASSFPDGYADAYPPDVSGWADTPPATTTEKPYVWARVIEVTVDSDNTYVYSTPSYFPLTGEKGADGENVVRLDLDNEYDTMLYDSTGTLKSPYVVARARLYDGNTLVSPNSAESWTQTATGLTVVTSTITTLPDKGKVYSVRGVTAATGTLTVNVTYKGARYSAVLTVDRSYNGERYQLAATPPTVIRYLSRGTQSHSQIAVSAIHGYLDSSGAYLEERLTTAEQFNAHRLYFTMNSDDSYDRDQNPMQTIDDVNTKYTVRLWRESTVIDIETIPVAEVMDGEGALVADLDNEMDSVALTYDGKVASDTVIQTTASLYLGTEEQTLTDCTVSGTGVTPSDGWGVQVVNNGVSAAITITLRKDATLDSDRATFEICLECAKGKNYINMTVIGVRAGENGESPKIHNLKPSATAIKLSADGTYAPTTLACTDEWQQGEKSGKGGYTIRMSIDGTSEKAYASITTASVKPKVGVTYKLYKASPYNTTNLVDTETVPVVIDGSSLSYSADPAVLHYNADADGYATGNQVKRVSVHVYINGEERRAFFDGLVYESESALCPSGITVTSVPSNPEMFIATAFDGVDGITGDIVAWYLYYPGDPSEWDAMSESEQEDMKGTLGALPSFKISVPCVDVRAGRSGSGIDVQYTPDPAATPLVTHDTFTNGDRYMRTRATGSSVWGDWFLIVGEKGADGAYTDFQFARSAQTATASKYTAPAIDGTWSDAPVEVTEAYPYLWARVTRYDSDHVQDGQPTYIRLTGGKGDNAIHLELDNENDTILYDASDTPRGSAVTHARLYDGAAVIDPSQAQWSVVKDGLTASSGTSGGSGSDKYMAYTVTGLTAPTGTLAVTATYKGVSYTAVMSVSKALDGEKYQLAVTPSVVTRNLSSGVQTPTNLYVEVVRTWIRDDGSLGETYYAASGTALPAGIGLTLNGGSITRSVGDMAIDTTSSEYAVRLVRYSGTEVQKVLDAETIPVSNVTNGLDGAGSLTIEVDNEMEAVPLDEDGYVREDTSVTFNARIFYGTEEQTVVSSGSYAPTATVVGVAEGGYTIRRVSVNNGHLYVVVRFNEGAQLTGDKAVIQFTFACVRDTVTYQKSGNVKVVGVRSGEGVSLFQLRPSETSIKYLGGSRYTPSTISCDKICTYGAETTETNAYFIYYSVDGGSLVKYSGALTLSSLRPASSLTFKLFSVDSTNDDYLVDIETLPVLKDGTQITFGEYYRAGSSNTTPPPNYANPSASGSGWSTTMPAYNGTDIYLWNVEIVYTDGVPSVQPPLLIGNLAKGIANVVEYYGICDSGTDYSLVSSWSTEHIEPTDVDRYLWNKTVTTYTTGGNDTFYHLLAVKGMDGAGSLTLDLTNEMDGVALDEDGKVVADTTITTDVKLFYGTAEQVITAKSLTVSGVTPLDSSGYWVNAVYVSGSGNKTVRASVGLKAGAVLTDDRASVQIQCSCAMEGVTYTKTAVLTIVGARRGANGNTPKIYQLQVSDTSVKIDKRGARSVSTIECHEAVREGDGSSTATGTGHVIKYAVDGGAKATYSGAVSTSSAETQIKFWLYRDNSSEAASNLLDVETIPVIADGNDGAGLSEMIEWYTLTNSNSSAPAKGSIHNATGNTYSTGGVTWYRNIPEYNMSTPYLWNVEVSVWSDGERSAGNAILIGNLSGGRGITAFDESYAASASGTVPSGGEYPTDITQWQASQPELTAARPYMWNRTVVRYTQGGADTSYHVCAVRGGDYTGYEVETNIRNVRLTSTQSSRTATISATFHKRTAGARSSQSMRWVIFRRTTSGSTSQLFAGTGTSTGSKSITINSTDEAIVVCGNVSSATPTISSCDAKAEITVLKDGAQGDSPSVYSIEVVDSTAKIDARGKVTVWAYWKVWKTTGNETIVVSPEAGWHQYRLNWEGQWHDAEYNMANNTNNTDFSETEYPSGYGTPTTLELRHTDMGGNVLATRSIPFVVVGRMGRNFYYAGEWNSSTDYVLTDFEAPFVSYTDANTKLTTYHVRIGDNGSCVNKNPTLSANSTLWTPMSTDFKYLITEAVMASFAKLGSAVFNQDFMFSQHGVMRGFGGVDTVVNDASQYQWADPSDMEGSNIADGEYELLGCLWNCAGRGGFTNAWTDVPNTTGTNRRDFAEARHYSYELTGYGENEKGQIEWRIRGNKVNNGVQEATLSTVASGTIPEREFDAPALVVTGNFYCANAYKNCFMQVRESRNVSGQGELVRLCVAPCEFVPNLYMNLLTGKMVANNLTARGLLYASSVGYSHITGTDNDEQFTVGDESFVVLESTFQNVNGQAKVILPDPLTCRGRVIEVFASGEGGSWYMTWTHAASTAAFGWPWGGTGHRTADAFDASVTYMKLYSDGTVWRIMKQDRVYAND